ncbi:MAG: ABC transporter substrate-binding protein [Crocinitomicaceae bacterium]|nr:ABC transporter substrate-binding protein [Crocinitomicaceae bacterium]
MGQRSIVILSVAALFLSCIRHGDKNENDAAYRTKEDVAFTRKYAKGFDIQQREDGFVIETFSHSGNSEWSDKFVAPYKADHNFSQNAKFLPVNINRVCCQSSTYLAFLEFLGKIETVKGLCGKQYLNNKELAAHLDTNNAREICLGEKTQTETIIDINPDIYFVYPFQSEEVIGLEKKGVKTFMIAEYLELDPLARLEWIKVFGMMFGEFEKANAYFEEVEKEYLQLVKPQPDKEKKFIMNLPFGDSWHAPSTNSLIISLLQDAGLYYCFQDESGTENTIHSKEEMWQIGAEVPYWVIVANRPEGFTLEDLLAEEEVYATFRSVKEGKVIFCNTMVTDYFTYGVIEPHVLLNEIQNTVEGKTDTKAKYFQILK